jgi:hypothetical protein
MKGESQAAKRCQKMKLKEESRLGGKYSVLIQFKHVSTCFFNNLQCVK